MSYIDWPNKRMRDDPRMAMTPDMPFDGRRLIHGGFDVLLETGT